MIPIVHEFFKFKEPRILSEEEYYKAKELLQQFPQVDITPNFSFYEEKKGIMNFLAIGIPIIFISAVAGESMAKSDNFLIKAITGIGAIYIFSCFVVAIVFVGPEYVSFMKAKNKMIIFYKKLRTDLDTTNSYIEFAKRQQS